MALTSTIYPISLALNDSDRGVYENLDLRLACHPSETPDFMMTRLLAYCLAWEEGIRFTEGLSSGEQCAVQVQDLTGRVTHWIEVGAPSAERLHRGSKLAGRASVYTHRDPAKVLANLRGQRIYQADQIPLTHFSDELPARMAAALERRSSLSLSVAGGQIYAELNGQLLEAEVLVEPIEAAD